MWRLRGDARENLHFRRTARLSCARPQRRRKGNRLGTLPFRRERIIYEPDSRTSRAVTINYKLSVHYFFLPRASSKFILFVRATCIIFFRSSLSFNVRIHIYRYIRAFTLEWPMVYSLPYGVNDLCKVDLGRVNRRSRELHNLHKARVKNYGEKKKQEW